MKSAAVALVLALGWTATVRAQPKSVAPPPLTVACDDLDLDGLAAALVQEIDKLQVRSGPPLRFGDRSVSPLEYCNRTLRPLWELARSGDRARLCGALGGLAWYRVGPLLFTAYHTPTVPASLTADETHRFPLYRRPRDAGAQLSTAQILGGGLAGRGLELAWLADAYDVFALHVEGGANLTLPDGRVLAVGTDGHNGRPYTNVSKLLIADGKLPSGPAPPSSQPGNPKARRYFAEHPAELNAYWGRNPHFVFFKQVDKAGGGRFGPLSPGRSVAVDPAEIPLGALVFIRAQPFERLVLAQDTGSGIKGARMDVYFGEDEPALLAAQSLAVNGEAWVLVGR